MEDEEDVFIGQPHPIKAGFGGVANKAAYVSISWLPRKQVVRQSVGCFVDQLQYWTKLVETYEFHAFFTNVPTCKRVKISSPPPPYSMLFLEVCGSTGFV